MDKETAAGLGGGGVSFQSELYLHANITRTQAKSPLLILSHLGRQQQKSNVAGLDPTRPAWDECHQSSYSQMSSAGKVGLSGERILKNACRCHAYFRAGDKAGMERKGPVVTFSTDVKATWMDFINSQGSAPHLAAGNKRNAA